MWTFTHRRCHFQGLYFLFWKHKFNLNCEPIDYSTTDHGMAEKWLTYIYFLFKLVDLLDTVRLRRNCDMTMILDEYFQVFIVLKKKNSQLSFLHCYHHAGILLGSYMIAKWLPGGSMCMLGQINSFIHTIMYSYYFLTAFKPELKNSIWWKKYITQAQLAQFAFLSVFFLRIILAENCDYPKVFSWLAFIQNLFMLTMFGEFYVRVYAKETHKQSWTLSDMLS